MRQLVRSAGLVVLLAGVVAGQTAIVQNAAGGPRVNGLLAGFGYATFLLPFPYAGFGSNVVAPGMLAVFYRSLALGPATISATTSAPISATISLRPSGSDTPIRAEVISSTFGQTTFVVPRNMPLGGAEFEYETAGQPTVWTNVNMVAASFEFFRIAPGGPAIAQSVDPGGQLSPIGLTTPARPGQTILLKGSGLGNALFTVTVGGVPATVATAAPHRAQPGADEIRIQIPAGVPDGCYVPLVLTYNGTTGSTAVTTTISKTSNGAACVHPFQLSAADMKTLDNGGTIVAGEIDMSTTLEVTTPAAASRVENADVEFRPMAAADIAAFFPASQSGPGCQAVPLTTPGFFSLRNGVFSVIGDFINAGPSVFLENGANTLSLPGPGFYYSATLPQTTQGPVTNLPPSAIPGGTWKWYSTGGPDLAASPFAFRLPAPFQLNGSGTISMSRNVDQTLTWNGAAFDSGAILSAVLPGQVTCTAPANSGALTIPAALLGQIPASSLGTLSITVTESRNSMPHAQFRLQNGSTLLMLVNYSTGEATLVDFQ